MASRIFNTAKPPPSPDAALGFSAVYERGLLKTWHVTDDPARILDSLAAGVPLTNFGSDQDDLGPGFYGSAAPQLWTGRASGKWTFLDRLDDDQREVLAAALTEELERKGPGYLAPFEVERAIRNLGHFVETGHGAFVLSLAGQPYNIPFWKPGFLKPLDIEPGKQPQIIPMRLEGRFAGFENIPKRRQLEQVRKKGLDGAFLKGGLVAVAQIVIWKNSAVVEFGGVAL